MLNRIAIAAAILVAVAVPLAAHHGWSSYDSAKPLTLEGKITTSKFENPHATIVLAASDKPWTVILAPTSRITSRGGSAEMVAEGKTVSVQGYPSKTVADELRAERITADGKTVELR